MPCGQTELQEFTRYFLKVAVWFVTEIKEMEREKNEYIKNTPYRNHRI